MKYQPITCVWEVTMGCNMRCGHCGSSCAEPLPDELTTQEALKLCDQIAAMGLKWITLSGGEPLTRKDVPQLVRRLHGQGVSVNIITNGWLLDEAMAAALKENGIATVAISIDGTREIHNKIRREGAFEHAAQAFGVLKGLGIQTGAVTTVTKQNIEHLDEMKEALISIGVESWQVQLGLPMGNLKERPDWLLEPEQMTDIIGFCHRTAREGRIKMYPADCIGYYTKQELEVKRISYETNLISVWDGCNAGVRGFGILQNGDILGCTSIRSKEFVEGNIRERPLREIWEDENCFRWRREMSRDKLTGSCHDCRYAGKCLGGCPNTRLTMEGSIYSENRYCAYNCHLKRQRTAFARQNDADGLYRMARGLMDQGDYQEAAAALERVTELLPGQAQARKAKGYCEYMCGNYELCRMENEQALKQNPGDAGALQGIGLAWYRLGNTAEGINCLEQAAALAGGTNQDINNDLAVLKKEADKTELKKKHGES